MQALEEFIARILAAFAQDEFLTGQILIGLCQLIRHIARAETGDPRAPGYVIQRVLHHDAALPLRLGDLPDVADRRAVRISFRIVEELGQLDIERDLGLSVLGIDVLRDVGGQIVIKDLVLYVLVPQRTILVLDVHNVRDVLAGLVLARDLLEQLIGRDIERLALNARIFFHERLCDLGAAGGDRIERDRAFLLGQLVEFLLALIHVEDVCRGFPFGLAVFVDFGCLLLAAARSQ